MNQFLHVYNKKIYQVSVGFLLEIFQHGMNVT